MKEHPILFNAEMVRAVLDGRKTQTRRVVKDVAGESWTHSEFRASLTRSREGWWFTKGTSSTGPVHCPYGQLGDRLWVRERIIRTPAGIAYAADETEHYGAGGKLKATPSIHMPRAASRILLEITNVRVERVQDISEEDVHAEGCDIMTTGQAHAQAWFHKLWDSINAKRGYGWEVNPWVWVPEFKRIAP